MMPPQYDSTLFARLGYWALAAGIGALPVLILFWIAPGLPLALIFALCFADALLILLLFFVRWHRGFQSRQWQRLGQCPQCGYSRQGLTVPRCPECGTAFTDDFVEKEP